LSFLFFNYQVQWSINSENNDVHYSYFNRTCCATDRQISFLFTNIKLLNHSRKWDTSGISYYLELVYIDSIDHRYRIKKSCHCYNVLIRKATNIGSSLSWDSTLRYKCEQSLHLSFLLLVVSPKDSFRFNLLHLNRRNRQRNRQTDSVPSQNWSLLMVMNARVNIQYRPKRKQNCVTLNRLVTHRICATDPLQMIGSRVLVIINFALFYSLYFSFFLF
jgi:hypothetical protein